MPSDRSTDGPTGRPFANLPVLAAQPTSTANCDPERGSAEPRSARVQAGVGPDAARGRGPGRIGLQQLLTELSPRDIAVLDLLAEHRFLTTNHIQSFCFADHASLESGSRTARRVLARLADKRLIERPARRVGGLFAGSAAHTWMLTSVGQRLRSLRLGLGAIGRVRTPGERFVNHYLAIADVRLGLVSAERAGLLAVHQVLLEPASWFHFQGPGGSREILKPDLLAVTAETRDSEYDDYWFVEVDLGTESVPTVIRQCRIYEDCRQAGVVQAARDVFPWVVWLVPDDRRRRAVQDAIRRTRGIDEDLYRVVTSDGFVSLLRGGGG